MSEGSRAVMGQPLTGVQGVTFALYKEQSSGAALWLETQNVTADEQGRYAVLLGSTQGEGLPLELFASNEARWLGVQAIQSHDSDGAVLLEQPRILLVSVPYALKAADAETLGGLPASSFVLSPSAKTAISSTSLVADKGGLPVAKASDGMNTASLSGQGTTNNIVKWQDGPGGVLTDAANVVEVSGNVGIGTTSPSKTLDVAGTVRIATPGTDILQFINTGTGKQWTHYLAGNYMRYYEYGPNLDRLTLQADTGNVGIGTAGPGAKFHVNQSAGKALILTTASGNDHLDFRLASQPVNDVWAQYLAGNDLRLYNYTGTPGGDRVTFQAGGNVGIGTTTPAEKLEVAGNVKLTGTGNGIKFPDNTTQTTANLTRGLTYIAGCDWCGVFDDSDSQSQIYYNVVGNMTINSITCFSHNGTAQINIGKNGGSGIIPYPYYLTCDGTPLALDNTLNLNDKFDFLIVHANNANRVTVTIKLTLNQ